MKFKNFFEGKMLVYRGVGPRGMAGMRPSEGGVHGPGIYFYDNEKDASAYAGVGGGVIVGEVDTDDPDVMVTEPEPVTPIGLSYVTRYRRIIIVRDTKVNGIVTHPAASKVKIIDRKQGV